MTLIENVWMVGDGRDTKVAFLSLKPRYVHNEADIRAALEAKGLNLWIAEPGGTPILFSVIRALVGRSKPRHDSLLVLEPLPAGTYAVLVALFHRVLARPSILVPREELAEVLASPERADRCIGGVIEAGAGVATLYRGDLSSLSVPLSVFRPTSHGLTPDFTRFSVTDFGSTLCFGDYEAAFDAVLYERDPDFRRRLKKQRLASDRSFGASLRRLRKQRRLTLKDFPDVDPRTVARIEKGEIEKPRAETLALLAKPLGVEPDEIEEF